jgi:hypothetical protein
MICLYPAGTPEDPPEAAVSWVDPSANCTPLPARETIRLPLTVWFPANVLAALVRATFWGGVLGGPGVQPAPSVLVRQRAPPGQVVQPALVSLLAPLGRSLPENLLVQSHLVPLLVRSDLVLLALPAGRADLAYRRRIPRFPVPDRWQ